MLKKFLHEDADRDPEQHRNEMICCGRDVALLQTIHLISSTTSWVILLACRQMDKGKTWPLWRRENILLLLLELTKRARGCRDSLWCCCWWWWCDDDEGRAPDDVTGDRARRKSDVRRLWSASTTMRSVDNVRYNTREACGASGRSSV